MSNWIRRRAFSRTERFNEESDIKYGNKKLDQFSDEELNDLDNRLAEFGEDRKGTLALFGLCGLLGYGVAKSIGWIIDLTATKWYRKGVSDLVREEIKGVQRDRQKLKREIK